MLALCIATASLCAARNLPQDAHFGKLTQFAYPFATIAGKTLRMGPGARIYNEQTMIIMPTIIMPTAMRQQAAAVLYRLDYAGELSAIWILTAEEAAAYAKSPPATPATAPGGPTGR